MDNRSEENLNELFGRWVDAEQAAQHAEDIEHGDQIFRDNPPPEPRPELVARIKADVNWALVQRKERSLRRKVYGVAIAAAVIVISVAVGPHLFTTEEGGVSPTPTESIWASEDAELEILTSEVEALESELFALQFGENGGNGFDELSELEMELVEVSSSFWKG